MSTADIDRLISDYNSSDALRGQLDAAEDFEGVAAAARAAGYDVSIDEISAHRAALRPHAELSEAELDSVAGGVKPTFI